MKDMQICSEEYAQIVQKIFNLKSILMEHRDSIKQINDEKKVKITYGGFVDALIVSAIYKQRYISIT